MHQVFYTEFDYFPYNSFYGYVPQIDSKNGLVCQPQFNENGFPYKVMMTGEVSVVKGKRYSIEVEIRGDQPGELLAYFDGWCEYPSVSVDFSTEWETRRFYFDEPVRRDLCNIIFLLDGLSYSIYVRRLKVIYEGD